MTTESWVVNGTSISPTLKDQNRGRSKIKSTGAGRGAEALQLCLPGMAEPLQSWMLCHCDHLHKKNKANVLPFSGEVLISLLLWDLQASDGHWQRGHFFNGVATSNVPMVLSTDLIKSIGSPKTTGKQNKNQLKVGEGTLGKRKTQRKCRGTREDNGEITTRIH